MDSNQHKQFQTVWAVLLLAMGVFLCVKTPYALRAASDSAFLNFARYFIAVFLIVGGARKLYGLYFSKEKESPPDE
ncbi:MAG: hypothetical protein HWN68_01895 [Desulfobacterales bacterium]|nr:hypothetical protein [Desulfobacterales bacterium]